MAVEVKARSNENAYGLLRRFQDKLKKSRAINLAKKNMRYEKTKTKRQRKVEALNRLAYRRKREYLIKIGKLSEEMIGRKR